MKRTLIVTAWADVFATAAHAQCSVTLYGLIDAGITYPNNQGRHAHDRRRAARSTAAAGAFAGTDDLGGGLKAIFTPESGFGINNGSLKHHDEAPHPGRLFVTATRCVDARLQAHALRDAG
ncbi:porin, Gram-negative type [Burkholderia cepacia GG4]|uniref:Porin, Gram-negative type n=2 Tax=Burkholderia cepacia TaxID=292 RepID=A0A9W3K0Z9_BURCE|nr:porin, Gram-negative type [Burkholderia cepacia GG4]